MSSRNLPLALRQLPGVARLHCARLAHDSAEDACHCALVERPGVGAARARKHLTLAVWVVQRKPGPRLHPADSRSKSRAPVQKAQQLVVNLVNLRPPVFDPHPRTLLKFFVPHVAPVMTAPRKQKEPAATPCGGSRGWLR